MSLEVAKALLEKLERDRQVPTVMPATVVGLDDDPDAQPIPLAHVEIDGNPPGMVNVVPIATAGKLALGQRVLVHFDPPAGAYIVGTITRGSGGTRPYATLVIAAADTVATDAENADFVCDGTDDEEQIAAALDLATEEYGGRVLLLDGQFVCATGALVIPNRVVLAGLGREATTITFVGDGPGFQFEGGAVEDLRLYVSGGSIFTVGGSATARFRRCIFNGPDGA